MSVMERVMLWAGLVVLAAAMGAFVWAMVELTISSNEMFDSLEAALEARDG